MHKRCAYTLVSLLAIMFLGTGTAWASYSTERIGGADRYETSALISQKYWVSGSDQIVLATGTDFADAITGAPLAGRMQSPILLTKPDELPPVVAEEIDRLNADLVIVLGGPGAVSNNVVASLKEMGLVVKRIAGTDRYDTARLIAHEIAPNFDQAYVVTGRDFPDALSAASLAATEPVSPILLVNESGVPQPTKDAFTELGIMSAAVIGGDGVIPDNVKNMLPGAMRISGRDRYETAAIVFQMTVFQSMISDLLEGDFTPNLYLRKVFIASGTDFPDALSGGPAAASQRSGIVLTPPTALSFGAKMVISSYHPKIRNTFVLGGAGALGPEVEAEVASFSSEETVVMFMSDPHTMLTQMEISQYMMDEMMDDLSDVVASMDAMAEMASADDLEDPDADPAEFENMSIKELAVGSMKTGAFSLDR